MRDTIWGKVKDFTFGDVGRNSESQASLEVFLGRGFILILLAGREREHRRGHPYQNNAIYLHLYRLKIQISYKKRKNGRH